MANSRVKTIEAVITCFDYSDFLVETLPHNMNHFEHVVVVTSFEDKETQQFCREHSIHCVQTDVHNYDGATFSKGRAVDYGLSFLNGSDWLVHMDADVYLPPKARQEIDASMPDPECIYGIDRVNCNSYEDWQKYISQPAAGVIQKKHHCLVTPPLHFPLGARLSLSEHAGYIPIGFFQMWHGKHKRRYPLCHGTAERSDVLHALQWPTNNRRLMPEVVCIHLDTSENPLQMGANWNGRKTPQFGHWNPFGIRHGHHHHHEPKPYC